MSLSVPNARYQSSSHLAFILMRRCGAQIARCLWINNLAIPESYSREMDGEAIMAVRNRFRPGYEPNNEYYTPPEVFTRLGLNFDLDVCAPEQKLSWIPAKQHYWEAIDGLSKEWDGRIWMNPPYSGANAWHLRFKEHRNGVALVQVSRNKTFIELWNDADGIVLMPHNFKFVKADGSFKEIFMPVALIAYGQENVEAIKASGWNRAR